MWWFGHGLVGFFNFWDSDPEQTIFFQWLSTLRQKIKSGFLLFAYYLLYAHLHQSLSFKTNVSKVSKTQEKKRIEASFVGILKTLEEKS